ncbi:hypothetical protein SAMN04489752_1286 [Brevibacterium siliguriense]|uniref:Uncharacterized protein n=1 Tax=Brevibacterium siliguriense TaxID=1136497 RepID=A0A1H1QLZ0_9MICO|nr:hypothetical protein [Brevibacterium siliguriense]SDS24406.1 hypothetical protein SAMN04489752_1286 [Brevibacterium siliguriense]
MSTEDNSTDGSSAGNMRKATENLDHEAGGAPSSEYLDKVNPDDFGRKDGTGEDEDRDEDAASDDEASAKGSPSTDH